MIFRRGLNQEVQILKSAPLFQFGIKMKLWNKLVGGRPMVKGEYAMIDVISGKPIFYFTDTFDRIWLAETAWSIFRCHVDMETEELQELHDLFEESFRPK